MRDKRNRATGSRLAETAIGPAGAIRASFFPVSQGLSSIPIMKQAFVLIFALAGCLPSIGQETLPVIKDGKVPHTYEALWADFDARAEPLEVEKSERLWNGIPTFTVTPDASQPILSVEMYYTQQGQEVGGILDRDNRINRFWHFARSKKSGNTWTADLPLISTDQPLWVYANVRYPLEEPVTGAGYYYRVYTANTFALSSRMHIASADQMKANKVRATLKPSLMIESFKGDWEKEWFAVAAA